MMKHTKYIPVLLLAGFITSLLLSLTGCEADPIKPLSIIKDIPVSSQPEDIWLDSAYRAEYNVEIKYRWDETESDLTKNMVPARLEMIVPLMYLVKIAWVEPYTQLGGDAFMKTFIPKLFYLIGSPEINDDGTITQGSAEAGRKIILNEVNNFTKAALVTKHDSVFDQHTYFHVIQHEFAHILNQKRTYPVEFKTISKGHYTAQWFNVRQYEARRKGFISSYAMMEPDEDFAEMVAWRLTYNAHAYDSIISRGGAQSKAILQTKGDLVEKYFQEEFNIDILELQKLMMERIQIILDPSFDIFKVPGYRPKQ